MDSGICTPQELDQERTAAQRVDIPVPPVMEEIEEIVNETAERVRLAPHERVQQGTVMVTMPWISQEIVEAVRAVPFERVQTTDRRANCRCTSTCGTDRRGGEVGPTRTCAVTDQRANCRCASPAKYGG